MLDHSCSRQLHRPGDKRRNAKPVQLIRALRPSPKHFAKLRERLLAAGITDPKIARAMANSSILVSPLKITRGST